MTTCQQDSLGRLIYLTSLTIRKHVERVLKPFDVTSEQFHLLKNTDMEEGRPQSEIGELVGKSAANLTRILDRLEKKKLIVRKENPQDRRSTLIYRTEIGEKMVNEVSSLFSHFSSKIERGLAPGDVAVFRKVLAHLDKNIERLQ